MDAKPTMIGKTGYPIDNSYAFTIGSEDNPHLAGHKGIGFPAKKVTIISEPFKMSIDFLGIREYEFVTVRHNRKLHVVLNCFNNLK